MIGEYDSAGIEIKTYGYKPGSTWTTDPLFMKVGGEYYFYHNDHLGTPQKMTGVNGAVVWSAKYSSFGKATVEVETVENNLRFGGQYEDSETGLYYNCFRYYDSTTGRFLTTDPLKLSSGINQYVYALNNPNYWLDPLGKKNRSQSSSMNRYEYWHKQNQRARKKNEELRKKIQEEYSSSDAPILQIFKPSSSDPRFFDEGLGDTELYCDKVSRYIGVCADAAMIGGQIATYFSGGTASPVTATVGVSAKIVSVTNGTMTAVICGPKPSSITSTVGVRAPGWWGAAVSAIDAALTMGGY